MREQEKDEGQGERGLERKCLRISVVRCEKKSSVHHSSV